MLWIARTVPLSACAALAACGGAGGEVVSTPAPPPEVRNTTLTDLRASQTFTNDAAANDLAFDLTANSTVSARNTPGALTIRYDAPTNSYTVTTGGRAQSFGSADIIANDADQTRYRQTTAGGRDFLTLVKVPFSGTSATQYVGLGFLQRDILSGSRQTTQFTSFTYGLDTTASAVPRTGTAGFDIDVFGVVSAPGSEPRRVQGRGQFSTDFAAGVFSSQTFLEESGLLTGSGVVGGGIELTTAGRLSASDGTFAGNMLLGSSTGNIPGSVAGRFYGPAAQELGASFAGSNPAGSSVAGSFTGQRRAGGAAQNLTLTNLTGPELFFTDGALLSTSAFDNRSDLNVSGFGVIGQLNRQSADLFTFSPGLSSLPGGTYGPGDIVASSDRNFIAYRKSFNGQQVDLLLYRPGAVNTQLALTYSSLGRWSTSSRNGVVTQAERLFFAYGLPTPAGILAAKSGTGTYAGVIYGAGANRTTGAMYDVTGTSSFNVDFGRQSYSGALALSGAGRSGAAALDFGRFDFAGRLAASLATSTAPVTFAGASVGEIQTRFYGPDGEEIAGSFTVNTPGGTAGAGVTISGATAATRR